MKDSESERLAMLRSGIRSSLPEIELIGDEALRTSVVEVHAQALAETGYNRLEDIPPSGVPEGPKMKRGTQADHYRGVAAVALGMAKGLEDTLGSIGIDRDLLIAAALVHDVGKAYEFWNWDRWKTERSRTGSPSLRHPVYGAHLAIVAGLSDEVVHAVAAHAYMAEGAFVKASLEATIVQYADVAFWKMLEAAGLLESDMDVTGAEAR